MKKFMMHSPHFSKLIDFENFTNEDVNIFLIASHLSKIQRFGGGMPHNKSWSVAQHSMWGAIVYCDNDPELSLAFLLHDASEAYLQDIPTGLKNMLPDYKEIEHKIQGMINAYFLINRELMEHVKIIDRQVFEDEVNYFYPQYLKEYGVPYNQDCLLHTQTEGNDTFSVYRDFLNLYEKLMIELTGDDKST